MASKKQEELLEDIVLSPDPRLEEECAPLTEEEIVSPETTKLAERMLDDMYAADGCGLAGPQIGVMKQIVVIDVDYVGKKRNPYVLLNPKVITADGPMRSYSEGCLSFPGISVDVERPSHVIVHAYNLDGELMQYEAEGDLLAVCLQHEIDHVHGITMVDHLSPMKKVKALRAYNEALANGARPGDVAE